MRYLALLEKVIPALHLNVIKALHQLLQAVGRGKTRCRKTIHHNGHKNVRMDKVQRNIGLNVV